MKKAIPTFLAALFGLALATGAQAMDMSHGGHDMDHGQTMTGDHGSMAGHDMDMPSDMGQPIRKTVVDGYQLSYQLIDMKAQMAGHEMPAEMKSHHLMVYVTGPQGDKITDAKTGYLLTGPDGEQKAMTMAMSGGYGADVDLEPAGTYQVKTKVVTPDGKTLLDDFTYEAK